MDILYSHTTALKLLREHAGDAELARSSHAALAPAQCPTSELYGSADEPVHVLVSAQQARVSRAGVCTHLRTSPLPSGAVHTLGPTVGQRERLRLCSPEIAFIQLAEVLEVPKLILLGYELCGSFSVRPSTGELVEHEPLTTPARLASMVERCGGMHGVRQARRALRHVLPGSASPFESILSMLAHLPPSLGGYGLGAPELNPILTVPSATRALTPQRTVSPDQLFRERREVVEYESDEFHLDKEKHTRDSHRRSVLRHMGYHVTTITRGQVFDVDMFDTAMRGLAKALGRRLRVGGDEWRAARRLLRKALLDPYRSEQRDVAKLARLQTLGSLTSDEEMGYALPPDWKDIERGIAEESHGVSTREEAEFWQSVD